MTKKNSKLLAIVISLSLMLIDVVFIYFSYKIKDTITQTIVNSLCISVFTALIVSLITYLLNKNDYEDAYRELVGINIPFLYKLNDKGLVEFDKTFPLEKEDYKKDFLKSKEVVLVMNDGKRFVSNNITLFKQRLNENNKTTRFIFMNPESSDSISVLTRKNGHSDVPSYYEDKIKTFSCELENYEKSPSHTVDVLYQDYFTTMGILLTDSYAMISLYRISPGKDDVPNLIFKKNDNGDCEFNKIKADVQRIMSASKNFHAKDDI